MNSVISINGHRFYLRIEAGHRESAVRRMISSGYPVPFSGAAEWGQYAMLDSWYLEIEHADGRSCGGVAIHVLPSRALPGFRILRVERLGENVSLDALEATFRALIQVARAASRVLRLHIETFARDPERFDSIAQAAERVGLTAATKPRANARTLVLPLDGDIDTIFASLPTNTRRNVRMATKKGLVLRPVTEVEFAPQMNVLLRETLGRTGGEYAPPDWSRIIRYAADFPQRSRIAGLFSPDGPAGSRLLAFAWGCWHGNHGEYSLGASTRAAGVRVPMGYPLVWDLIRWSRSLNAEFFDFGGITVGTAGSADPVGGISDFKRHFGGHTVECGQEFEFSPSRLVDFAGHLSSSTAGGVRNLVRTVRAIHR
jgi:hypothetical protein